MANDTAIPVINDDEERERIARMAAGGIPALLANSGTIPSLQRPNLTGKQEYNTEKQAMGFNQPLPANKTFSPEFFQEREAKNQFEKMHPWGSPVSAHPGVWGKIGHVASEIGQAAGNALAPNIMERIPGSEMNRAAQTQENMTGFQKAQDAENKLEMAKEREQTAEDLEAKKAETQEDIQKTKGEQGQELQKTKGEQGKELQTQKGQQAEDLEKIKTQYGMKPVVGTVNGQPAHAVYGGIGRGWLDPTSGAPLPGFKPPENWAQGIAPTKTTELLGPDGVMHRFQFNPATGRYDTDMGAAPTGTAAHQIFQASAIENLVPTVVTDIEANRDILGNLSSYYKQWLAGTPVGDPRAAQMMTELMSLAAMQPALHAFRSSSALEAFEKMIGGLAKNPDATIASINGILKTPEAFTNLVKPKGGAAKSGAPKVGDIVDGYKFKGGDPADQKNWEKQ